MQKDGTAVEEQQSNSPENPLPLVTKEDAAVEQEPSTGEHAPSISTENNAEKKTEGILGHDQTQHHSTYAKCERNTGRRRQIGEFCRYGRHG